MDDGDARWQSGNADMIKNCFFFFVFPSLIRIFATYRPKLSFCFILFLQLKVVKVVK